MDYEITLDLLIVADYLSCLEIVKIATRILKLTITSENVLGTLMFCRQYSFTELEKWSWNFIEYTFLSVYNQEEFLLLPVEDLAHLLSSSKLNVSEMEAFMALNRWVHHDLTERAGHILRLFGLIRHTQLWTEAHECCPKVFKVLQVQELTYKN